MIRRRLLQGLAGLVGVGAALIGLAPTLAELPRPPSPAELARLAGPLRALPVPFLWEQWARARGRHDPAASAATGRLLAWLLPEREDLFVGFAWELAYDAASLASGARARAECLLEALVLLEQGRRLHPGSAVIPRTAAFLLRDRCDASLSDDPALRAEQSAVADAFRTLTGRRPLDLALQWLEGAPPEPDVGIGRDHQLAVTAALLAVERLRAGDTPRAVLLLERASAATADPDRRARLAELAQWLRQRGPETPLPADLRAWLDADAIFGQDAALWNRKKE